jgi:hypothetical protein
LLKKNGGTAYIITQIIGVALREGRKEIHNNGEPPEISYRPSPFLIVARSKQ